jgi:hypothetical protein
VALARPRRKHHGQHRGAQHERGAKVGLDQDQQHRRRRHQEWHHESTQPAQLASRAHPLCQREHHRQLGDLAWLKLEQPKADPSARAVLGSNQPLGRAGNQHEHQQRQTDRVQRPRGARDLPRAGKAHRRRHQHAEHAEHQLTLGQ